MSAKRVMMSGLLGCVFAASLYAQTDQQPEGGVAQTAPKQAFSNTMLIRLAYRRFIDRIGQEDQVVKNMQTPAGAQMADRLEQQGLHPQRERASYETLIGLSSAQVELILDTVLPSFHALQTVDLAYSRARLALQAHPDQQPDTTELKQLTDDEWNIVDDARSQLRSTLDSASFDKLDAWIIHSGRSAATGTASQPVATRPSQSNLRIRYYFFIEHIGQREERLRHFQTPEGIEEAKQLTERGLQLPHPVRYDQIFALTPDQLNTFMSITLKAYHDISQGQDQQRQLLNALHSAHSPEEIAKMGAPPALKQLTENEWALAEEAATQLKASLGDQVFNRIDAWVTAQYGHPTVLDPKRATSSSGSPLSKDSQ